VGEYPRSPVLAQLAQTAPPQARLSRSTTTGHNSSMLNEWLVFGTVAVICVALVMLLRLGLGDDGSADD
jgi:hypothetical protein